MENGQEAPSSPSDGSGITFEEIEQQLKAAETGLNKPDLSKVVVDSDDAPEILRGKSVSEVLAHTKALENALKASEQARQEAMLLAQTAADRRQEPQAPPAPAPEPEITDEQVAEAFQEDPAKGVALLRKMQEQAVNRAAEHFGKRLEPLISGSSSAAEAEARRKYPDEFELYKKEIEDVLKQIPNKQVMSNQQSWDDMIAYVRGKDPMRLFNHLNAKESKAHETAAQTAERASVGFQGSSAGAQRSPQGKGSVVMDETTKEICKVLGMSEEDYVTWSRVR